LPSPHAWFCFDNNIMQHTIIMWWAGIIRHHRAGVIM
jgi:hypothetical protein